jgi:hypothetical protein
MLEDANIAGALAPGFDLGQVPRVARLLARCRRPENLPVGLTSQAVFRQADSPLKK